MTPLSVLTAANARLANAENSNSKANFFPCRPQIQLLEDDDPDAHEWHVFRSWGRIGCAMEDKNHKDNISKNKMDGPFATIGEALIAFQDVYCVKTGNNWSERANFVKVWTDARPIPTNICSA